MGSAEPKSTGFTVLFGKGFYNGATFSTKGKKVAEYVQMRGM